MNCALLLVSYAPDAGWAEYCLRSIQKFAREFSSVTVLVPQPHRVVFDKMCQQYGAILRSYEVMKDREFLHHEVCKLEADLWCPQGTELVFHIDSDCIFTEPVTPETYFYDGRPTLMRERYSDLEKTQPDHYFWKHGVEAALRFQTDWQTMRRHPGIFFTKHYKALREHVEAGYGMPFAQYVLLQKSTFPWGFTEFPTMGAYAIEKFPDAYSMMTVVEGGKRVLWTDRAGVETEKVPPAPLKQFWSRQTGGVDKSRDDLERLLG